MNDGIFGQVVTVLLAIITVAIIAVLVSGRSNTSQVLQAGGGAFSGILQSALSPVTGSGGFNLGGFNFGSIGFTGGPALSIY